MTTKQLPRYESLEEVMKAAIELRDEVALRGAAEAAQELTSALDCFYTTSSEALGEIRGALVETRSTWEKLLSQRYRLLGEHAISEATRS